MSKPMSFLDACLRGLTHLDEVDDWIDRWHDREDPAGDEDLALQEYLGLTEDEYSDWVIHPNVLRDLLLKRECEMGRHV